MKPIAYLLYLALAATSGVTPAGAEGTNKIYFAYSPVGNGCGMGLLLNPDGPKRDRISIPADGGRVVEKATVEAVEFGGINDFLPTRSMNVRELASCLFDQCILEDSIRLTCVGGLEGGLTSETVIFKARKGRTDKR